MKIRAHHSCTGYTLVEMVTGFGLFALLMACYLSLHVACLRLCRFETIRHVAVNQALGSTSRILMDMRGAYSNRVGSITGSDPTTFVAVADGVNQVGDALQIVPTNSSAWVCYYYVAASNNLYRADSGSTARTIVAGSVTNYTKIFQEELVTGTIRTNAVATSITSVNLRFFTTNAASTNYFRNATNFLSFRARAVPRSF